MKIDHAGDCSIYGFNCRICDCGELARLARKTNKHDQYDDFWHKWAMHCVDIDKSTSVQLDGP